MFSGFCFQLTGLGSQTSLSLQECLRLLEATFPFGEEAEVKIQLFHQFTSHLVHRNIQVHYEMPIRKRFVSKDAADCIKSSLCHDNPFLSSTLVTEGRKDSL